MSNQGTAYDSYLLYWPTENARGSTESVFLMWATAMDRQ